jgi:hypothetical protein
MIEQIRDYTIEGLENLKGTNPETSEIHYELFNSQMFIIGTEKAKKWVEKIGAFDVIGEIVDYETVNYGEVHTDCSDPEKVASMHAYIKGEDILYESETFNRMWDEQLNDNDLQKIINELN